MNNKGIFYSIGNILHSIFGDKGLDKVGELAEGLEISGKVKKLLKINKTKDVSEVTEVVENVKEIGDSGKRLIPGNVGEVVGGSSTKLGKNMMESMGLKRSSKWGGYQAQHIIPAELAEHPVLQKIGMDLNDASNGLLLRIPDTSVSTMSRHSGYHSIYNEVVRKELNKIDINLSVDELQKKVFDLQNDLKKFA